MATLTTDLRNELGKVIVAARRQAETGARMALQALAVESHEPHGSMSPEERALRNRLRARGRQLGDVRDKVRGTQSVDRLIHEVAYEHWHRMLFARFLAENDLLIEPETGVAISMEDCENLAREAGEDPHAMAARFAQQSLPQIFRSDDPVLELNLPPECRQALEKLLDSLPSELFTADDSLGWTYQFWQTEKKKAVKEAGNKIGADELPAVTQLFTEHYMVLNLYHNTIGAWHAGRMLAEDPDLAESSGSEQELRDAVRLRSHGGYAFDYLRFVREPKESDEEGFPSGPWRPAAGNFEGWPRSAKNLKILDPCCGSGHFLVEGLEILVRLRMDEEGLELTDAIRSVLAENLYGLEIDPRCTQIAAFNLAMAAWKMAGNPIELPPLHIACSGLAVGSTKDEWVALAADDGRLRVGMERLYDLFEQAPELGSLIDPTALEGDMFEAESANLQPLLRQALELDSGDDEESERAVAAQGMARSAQVLAGEYTLLVTNVPYLGRGQQSDVLKEFAAEHYETAKADLATVFVERMLRWVGCVGTAAAVTPQNWLFLTSYKNLREKLLNQRTWNLVVRLGAGAFETIGGEVVNVALPVISGADPSDVTVMSGIDATRATTPSDKSTLLRGEPVAGLAHSELVCVVSQVGQLGNPDARIAIEARSELPLLSKHADASHGIGTFDSPRFRYAFWETAPNPQVWVWQQSTPSHTKHWGGCHFLLRWEDGVGSLASLMAGWEAEGYTSGKWRAGIAQWRKEGVIAGQMGELPATLYAGYAFDENASAVIPADPTTAAAIWSFFESDDSRALIRTIDDSIKVTCKTLVKIPFDLDYWQKIAAEKYPDGLPAPQSDDPTQWLFHGHPAGAHPTTILQVVVGRLLGHRWPPEFDPDMRLADEAHEWAARCEELSSLADKDGIVCLLAMRGERSAADRLREILAAGLGAEWSAAMERKLLATAGDSKKTAASLEIWLRDNFFEEHCKLFHHRPYVWHIWDGNRDGFHCLVSAHKLAGRNGEGRRTLEALTFSYLGDWIDRQKADQQEGKEGADVRLSAAQDLQGQLGKILEGDPPYDLFIRWKPLHEQPIGWDPDIDDCVRLNIRPFMKAELRKGGKKGAGILRWKPNIRWAKDRGKEPESLRPKADFPWFWGCKGDGTLEQRIDFDGGAEFDGNRWNDLHYTAAYKQAARESASEGGGR